MSSLSAKLKCWAGANEGLLLLLLLLLEKATEGRLLIVSPKEGTSRDWAASARRSRPVPLFIAFWKEKKIEIMQFPGCVALGG